MSVVATVPVMNLNADIVTFMTRFKLLLWKFTASKLVFTLTGYSNITTCFHAPRRSIYAIHLQLPPIFQQRFDKVHLF